MADNRTPESRSALMGRVRQKNTAPEIAVRRLLHSLGFRFRLHRRDLPGTPDIVLPSRKTAIFVHGCFWHGHDCVKGRRPKSAQLYWDAKLAANRERDLRKKSELETAGWRVETIWQCELADIEGLTARLTEQLRAFRKVATQKED